MRWFQKQSAARQLTLIVMLAVTVGCVAIPMGLHHAAKARIREITLDAIRFAASSPEQLRRLPVTNWREGEKVVAASLTRTGWERYQMVLPQGETSTIIDVDLRSAMLPLLLGFGGWLRILVMIALSGGIAYLLLKRCGYAAGEAGLRRVTPDGAPHFHHQTSPMIQSGTEVIEGDAAKWDSFLQEILRHIPSPAFFFDTHHQLAYWNDAAQAIMPHAQLTTGIHMLDLSAHLPWGRVMAEKMDELAHHPALVIHKGDSLCVIPG